MQESPTSANVKKLHIKKKKLTLVLGKNKLNWVSGNLSVTLCNLKNGFHSLGLNLFTCQVKELKVAIFKTLSSSDIKHACLPLGINVRAG